MVEEKIQGKDFVIRDKRSFTAEGEMKPESEVAREEKEGGKKAEEKKNNAQMRQEIPLPEISFSSFILSLSSSALLHFGEIPDPITNRKERNMLMAKQTIDILGILQEKTRGNLSKDEQQLTDNLLHDLRLRYIEESKKG